ncbi:glutathione S-transferase family protein [Sphingomicrobium astaxanthinifaciens]|uniref:glutathione S-transferase family protein n=1 Tax=Sphingomicrobium astaxanthinifaciens TaxID=1227949 RepID=UPI001FCCA3F8|nr:glutathione S-transferase [Sphingomicrobium astaxanthinifaciens]MCJ7422242.1 glutathione S-transferase [Sphingomicrobium astaxanthinifaciens]
MIIVHHLENSRSQRILWLLEELGLDYEVRRYARDPKTMLAPPELRAIHPLGKSPILEEEAVTYVESGAIMAQLAERHGRFGPPEDPVGARRWHQYMHYAEGSLLPPLFAMLVVRKLGLLGLPARKPIAGRIHEQLRFVEGELEGRDWFCGDELTAADMMMSFPLEAAGSRIDDMAATYPAIRRFLERCHARPAYQRALARGGEYAYAG